MLRTDLPSLQKAIIKYLAIKGPKTRNQVTKDLKKDNKAIRLAFNSLKKKNLVKEIGNKCYRGRKFPEYWLDFKGIILTLTYGVDHTIVKNYMIKLADDEENQRVASFIVDMAMAIGPENWLHILDLEDKRKKGKLTFSMLTFKSMPLKEVQLERFAEVLKKYPEMRQEFLKSAKNMVKLLEE